jgi:hypothetical protein
VVKIFNIFIIVFILSCSHRYVREIVATSDDSRTAIVHLNRNEVSVGDILTFEQSDCSLGDSSNLTMHELTTLGGYPVDTGYGHSECVMINLGRGEIVELLDENYSILKIENDFQFIDSAKVNVYSE